MSSKIIVWGMQPGATVTAFGDDSKYGDTNAFGFVFFKNEHLDTARATLRILKAEFRIPAAVSIHLKDWRSGHFRQKNGLKHLEDRDVLRFVEDAIYRLNALTFFVQARYWSGALPINQVHPTMGVEWSHKAMQAFLAQTALVELDLRHYTREDINVVMSRDSTMIQFMGARRRQAHGWVSGFSSIGALPGYVYRLEPKVQRAEDDLLLQFADSIVYLVSHAFEPDQRAGQYRRILNMARNLDVRRMTFTSEPEDSGEASWLQIGLVVWHYRSSWA